MRLLLFACFLTALASATEMPGSLEAVRPVLAEALKTFRTEGPKGWSFTQTTEGDGHSRVERYNAARPEFDRWILLQQDGRAPTDDEARDYREKLSRRSRGGTAPQLTDQLDLATLELVSDTAERATCRARLKAGETGDATARHLLATLTLHKPSRTIEGFELASTAPFWPTLGVKIEMMKTTLSYSLPDETTPSLLQKSETRLRGRAFLVKSLDADMTVIFTDYERAGRGSNRSKPNDPKPTSPTSTTRPPST